MQENNESEKTSNEVAFIPNGFVPGGSNTQRKPIPAPRVPTSNPVPRGPSSRGTIIWEIFRYIFDAIPTAPAWHSQPNPVTGKPNLSKTEFELWQSANREQVSKIREVFTQRELQDVTNPEKNNRGCFLFNTPHDDATPAQKVAIEAISGKKTYQVVVDSKGELTTFDARMSKKVVGEVDTSLPESPYRGLSKLATLKRRQDIANRCGLKMNIYSINQHEVDDANRLGFNGKKLHMGGGYGTVRGQLEEGNVHHMPAKSVSPLSKNYGRNDRFEDPGPTIWMRTEDHKRTASNGRSTLAKEYRDKQYELIQKGRFKEAFQMDVDNIRDNFPDGRYEPGLRQAMEHINYLDKAGLLAQDNSQLSIRELASVWREQNDSLQQAAPKAESTEKDPKIQAFEPPNNEDWAKFTANARALTAQLSTYDINTSASLLDKPLTTPQDYAQMLALSVGANLADRQYADPTSPFVIQRVGKTINVFANDSKIATIEDNKIAIARVMTAAEKESLENHQSVISSALQTQVQDSPAPKIKQELAL
jgi:hypothetical protein